MSDVGNIQPPQKKNDKPPSRYWYPTKPFYDLRFSHWVEILFSISLLVVAVSQLSIYSRQAGIMSTQANIADQQTKIMQQTGRAFITVSQLEIIPRISNNEVFAWTINPIVENSGTTAPRNLYYSFGFGGPYMFEWPPKKPKLRDPPGFPSIADILAHKGMKATVMGPQSKVSNFTTLNGFLASSLFGYDFDASTGEFVWGVLVYGDAVDPEAQHITEFCFILDRTTLVPESKTVPYERCDNHNCTDDECKRQ